MVHKEPHSRDMMLNDPKDRLTGNCFKSEDDGKFIATHVGHRLRGTGDCLMNLSKFKSDFEKLTILLQRCKSLNFICPRIAKRFAPVEFTIDFYGNKIRRRRSCEEIQGEIEK